MLLGFRGVQKLLTMAVNFNCLERIVAYTILQLVSFAQRVCGISSVPLSSVSVHKHVKNTKTIALVKVFCRSTET